MSSDKIVNFDSTPQKAGDIFQYIFAYAFILVF